MDINSGTTNNLIEQRALDTLETYSGSNNYILRLKYLKDTNKKFYPTRSQSDYILSYQNVTPKVAKKWVDMDPYFSKKIADEKLYTKIPEQVWVEKLLVEKDKSYHIWGKMFHEEQFHEFWLPKGALIKTHKVEDVNIDYSKYSHRPPLDHQKIAIERLAGSKRFILADDMGLGKTTSTIIAALETNVKKILIVCPASLKINWQREIENYTDRSVYISEGKNFSTEHDFVIVNYDILKNFYDLKDKDNSLITKCNFDLIILDECFTYDTKIVTEFGDIKIGDIVENGLDYKILTYNKKTGEIEYKKINRWIKKNTDTIYRIKFNNGLFIECTDNHKFYVKEKGYVKARELTTNDNLYMLSETINQETNLEKEQILFKDVCFNNKQKKNNTKTKRKKFSKKLSSLWDNNEIYNREKYEHKNLLFNFLCINRKIKQSECKNEEKNNNRKKWWLVKTYEKSTCGKSTYGETIINKNEKKQSHEKFRIQRKNDTKIERENFFIEGWEWTNNTTTKNFTRNLRKWVGNGITYINKRRVTFIQKFTTIIQSRYRKSIVKNSCGSGWQITQDKKMEVFGQKKNRSI